VECSAYRFGDEEPREEVEERVEEGSHNGSNLGVGGERHHHHPVVREGDEREELVICIPEELHGSPLEVDHRVCDCGVHQRLHQHVWNLNHQLRKRIRNGRIHPSRTLSVEHRALNAHHGLHSSTVVDPQE